MQDNKPEPKAEDTETQDNPATQPTPETESLTTESESNQKGDDQTPEG